MEGAPRFGPPSGEADGPPLDLPLRRHAHAQQREFRGAARRDRDRPGRFVGTNGRRVLRAPSRDHPLRDAPRLAAPAVEPLVGRLLHARRRMSRIERVTETRIDLRLARDGGTPARSRPELPMFPGGMELGEEEAEAAARVIRSHNVFRYYGIGEGPREAESFEREFAAQLRAK